MHCSDAQSPYNRDVGIKPQNTAEVNGSYVGRASLSCTGNDISTHPFITSDRYSTVEVSCPANLNACSLPKPDQRTGERYNNR